MKGINRAKPQNRRKSPFLESVNETRAQKEIPCIFISHINIDKNIAERIGEYIMAEKGLDIYLDIFDKDLQSATKNNDYEKICECIQKGIVESSAVLCLVSNNTKNSWWVPYEIGYGKHAGRIIGTLALKKVVLPEYLKIEQIIDSYTDLENFLNNLRIEFHNMSVYEKIMETVIVHPLKDIFE